MKWEQFLVSGSGCCFSPVWYSGSYQTPETSIRDAALPQIVVNNSERVSGSPSETITHKHRGVTRCQTPACQKQTLMTSFTSLPKRATKSFQHVSENGFYITETMCQIRHPPTPPPSIIPKPSLEFLHQCVLRVRLTLRSRPLTFD